MISLRISRVEPGYQPQDGFKVWLCRGLLEQRRLVEYRIADGSWIVPETVNGYWYGIELAEHEDM